MDYDVDFTQAQNTNKPTHQLKTSMNIDLRKFYDKTSNTIRL